MYKFASIYIFVFCKDDKLFQKMMNVLSCV